MGSGKRKCIAIRNIGSVVKTILDQIPDPLLCSFMTLCKFVNLSTLQFSSLHNGAIVYLKQVFVLSKQ